MKSRMYKGLAVTVGAGMLVAGGMTGPATAQPVQVGNLVNVNISNVLNNNTVQVTVPINVAANICGVDVEVLVLATQEAGDQTFTDCDARGNQEVSVTG